MRKDQSSITKQNIEIKNRIENCTSSRDLCQNLTDQEIINLAKQDNQCYLCLMERYEEGLVNYVKNISGSSKGVSEEIVQDVFIKAYVNLNMLGTEDSFEEWIYTLAFEEAASRWYPEGKLASILYSIVWNVFFAPLAIWKFTKKKVKNIISRMPLDTEPSS